MGQGNPFQGVTPVASQQRRYTAGYSGLNGFLHPGSLAGIAALVEKLQPMPPPQSQTLQNPQIQSPMLPSVNLPQQQPQPNLSWQQLSDIVKSFQTAGSPTGPLQPGPGPQQPIDQTPSPVDEYPQQYTPPAPEQPVTPVTPTPDPASSPAAPPPGMLTYTNPFAPANAPAVQEQWVPMDNGAYQPYVPPGPAPESVPGYVGYAVPGAYPNGLANPWDLYGRAAQGDE